MNNISLYIARRYIFSKSNTNAVNIIAFIAVSAILVATASLFIILSVFSGLEKMNLRYYSNVNPELKISPNKGKTIDSLAYVIDVLEKQRHIQAFSKVIEEKVYIDYKGRQDIAYLKGIDENFTKVTRLDTVIYAGSFLDFKRDDNFIVSNGIADRLSIYIDFITPADLLMPKAGTGLIKQESDAFTKKEAYSVGIFMLNDQYDKHIFTTLSLAQKLLQYDDSKCYAIEIKTDGSKSFNTIKKELQNSLGQNYRIETRQDLDSAFLRVMNIENLISYLIFTLVIIIACFNLAGTIVILILDKKKEIQTMISFGMPRKSIRNIFFNTGFIITSAAMFLGLLIASIIGLLQINFGLIMASSTVPFPFIFSIQNMVVVIITVLGLGGIVSWIVSRQIK